jgi:GxxExxY protein
MTEPMLVEEDLTRSVIGAFYEVYNTIGYGFLEQVYANALELELIERGHAVVRECKVVVRYKGREVGWQRLDMIVDGKLIVETKSSERLPANASRQALSYVKGTELQVALLLHFGPQPSFFRLVHTRKLVPKKSHD